MARARAVVDAVGARPVEMTAEEHDRTVAIASHLPHAVAFALAAAAGDAARTDADALALREIVSTGFRSTTRLAGSDPRMVAGFLRANAAHVRGAIARFRVALDDLDASLEDEAALAGLLAAARSARGSLAPWEEAS